MTRHRTAGHRPGRWLLTAIALASALGAPIVVKAQPIPESFSAEPSPPAPDYALATSWASRPQLEAPSDSKAVDVFYVHPTTYAGPNWNQDVADAKANAVTDDGVMRTQASAFADCCRVFAPRYRQAGSRAFASPQGDGGKAYDLAYQDVVRAFEAYLRNDNHGRPFILAGHSQGALHILRLLEERIDGRPEQAQLVAAYVIGIGVSHGAFGKALKHIDICRKPGQTGCVVSWNTFQQGSDPTAYIARSEGRYTQRFGDEPGKALVCINPLTFDMSRPAAGPDRHLGAVALANPPGPPALTPHAVEARCENGVLIASAPNASVKLSPLPNGSLHMQDMELFWGNIRADAEARSQAFVLQNRR
jgi:pimeloyl-ACP methyl ester carboxylesterase